MEDNGKSWWESAMGGITSLGNTALQNAIGNNNKPSTPAPAPAVTAPRSAMNPMVWVGVAIGAVVLLVVLLKK